MCLSAPVHAHDHFVQRTYYAGGAVRVSKYRTYYYRGIALQAYVPDRYYSPGFYGWASTPWNAPVVYVWDWADQTWYGYYSGYFTHSPVYPTPSLWIADYIISARLAEAYRESDKAEVPPSRDFAYSAGGFTPEVKLAIAKEVQLQIEAEFTGLQATTSFSNADLPTPSLLSGGKDHVYVVAEDLDVIDDKGDPCVVAAGDAVLAKADPTVNSEAVRIEIVASKGRDCRAGSTVSIEISALQELENQVREVVDRGLDALYSNAGRNGLPALPSSATAPPQAAAFAGAAPPPDVNVAAELNEQLRAAEKLEQVLGQTLDEVLTTLGKPRVIAHVGPKQIYFYDALKVIFVDGRVSAVQ
jgi:hypothetical protein